MAEFSNLWIEVWFVVTPKSPFKAKQTLLEDHHRYQMVYEAIREYPKLKPCDIEFKLAQPNYTIQTLTHLQERYAGKHQFALIMGEDNLKGFHKWKNYEAILEYYDLYVYPRISEQKVPEALRSHPQFHKSLCPHYGDFLHLYPKKSPRRGKNIRPLLPEAVWTYMDEMNFYR